MNVWQRLIGYTYYQTKILAGSCIPIQTSPKQNFEYKLRMESVSNFLYPDYTGHVLALGNPCQPRPRSMHTAALPLNRPVPSHSRSPSLLYHVHNDQYQTLNAAVYPLSNKRPTTQPNAHCSAPRRSMDCIHIINEQATPPPHRQSSAPRHPLTTTN